MRPIGLSVLAVALTIVSTTLVSTAASAQDSGFPFGSEMTLDANPMRGSKRIPVMEIDDNGAVQLDLYCKRAQGQFSVANDTVIFIAGTVEEGSCPADRAQADDAVLAALQGATNWRRNGDSVSFVGPRTLRFRLHTN
jgi:hypothetical protein